MKNQPTFDTHGDSLVVTIPADYGEPLSELVGLARKTAAHDDRMRIDWTALREAYLYAKGRSFTVGSRNEGYFSAEKAKVRLSEDETAAFLILYPPKQGGARLGREELLDLVEDYGIEAEMIDPEALEAAMSGRNYHEPRIIAHSRQPTASAPVKIDWMGACATDSKGFLSRHAADERLPPQLLKEVAKGSVVGVFGPSMAGKPGVTFSGKLTPPVQGPDDNVLHSGLKRSGKDSVKALATGHLRVEGPEGAFASVFPLLRVRDHEELVKLSKLDYFLPCSLVVECDLELASTIRVLGDIEVKGSIIRTSVECCGSLFVHGGVQHTERFPVTCAGVVSSSFFDHSFVEAHSIHVRRYSLKSQLSAMEMLTGAAKASISGGTALSGRYLDIHELGSQNGLPTHVEVSSRRVERFRAKIGSWAEELTRQGHGDDRRAKKYGRFILDGAAQLDRLDMRLNATQADQTILARVLHPGVTVRMEEAMREFSAKLEKVRITRERLGAGGRIAVERL